MRSPLEDILSKAEQFQNLSIKKTNAHYLAAEIYSRRHLTLGIPVTISTSIVATSIFATLTQQTQIFWLSLGTGALSICAAVLSGLQTFLRYSDLAGEHRSAAVSYESLRRTLDLFILEFRDNKKRDDALKRLTEIAARLDSIAEAAPTLPDSIYDAVKWRPASVRTYPPTAGPKEPVSEPVT